MTTEEKTKQELKRSHTILKQLRKRITEHGQGQVYEQEYQVIMRQIEDVLGIQVKDKKRLEELQPPDIQVVAEEVS